ncbi:methyltransferase domain-containing protein [Candidatus Azambacteria bacterium]|nr:methyltransferase domain-containing protein [Candidatus Azambacteria bacterium]
MLKKGKRVLFTEGVLNIRSVGAVAPTGRFVARAMAPEIKISDPPKIIVELGVGTGSITEEIVKRLRPEDRFIGIDSNKVLLQECKKYIEPMARDRFVCVEHADAQNIKHILKAHNIAMVDEVICTIPFRALSARETKKILAQVDDVLVSGGRFVFIRYLIAPATKEVFRALHNFTVVKKKIVMSNIPPTEVITMRKG